MISADSSVKAEGSASIQITNVWPTVIGLGEIDGLDLDDATLVYQAKVRSQDLHGTAFLEMWVHFPESGPYFTRNLDDTVSRTSDWKTMGTSFVLQPGQNPDKVTLNLAINGSGTIWVDDVRLLRRPRK